MLYWLFFITNNPFRTIHIEEQVRVAPQKEEEHITVSEPDTVIFDPAVIFDDDLII